MVDSKQNRLNVLFVHRNKYTLAEKELRKVCKSVEKRKEDSEIRGGGILSRLSVFLLTAALLAAVFPFAPLTADAADSFTEGYFTYSIREDETGNKAAVITDCDNAVTGDIVIPSTLGGYPLVGIGEYVFSDCTSLTSVTISGSVTEISSFAFRNCTSLTEIIVDGNNTEYKSVDGVLYSKDMKTLLAYPAGKADMSYTILDSVTEIGMAAFADCTSLFNIVLPKNLKRLEMAAFHSCDSLMAIDIPEGLTWIDDYVFLGCESLKSIDVPDSVTHIGLETFALCTSLKEITISDGVTYIPFQMFYGCTSLTEITLPDSVTEIDYRAFFGCTNLTKITIPASVTEIAGGDGFAFMGCPNLTIFCCADSVAHNFAINCEIPFVLLDETDPEPQPDPDLDIDEEAGMIRSEAGMTIEALLAGLAGGSYTVTDANGAALSSGALVGTGAVVTRTAAGETVRYTVVVRGDVNGDGRQTATDYLRTKRAVLKIEAPEGVYYEAAACFDGRDGLTAADYLSMKRAILGLA